MYSNFIPSKTANSPYGNVVYGITQDCILCVCKIVGEDSSLTHSVTGTSAVCPNPDTNADKTLCNSDRNTCLDGVCSGSICLLKNFTECQCTEPSSPSNRLCDICCNVTVGNNSRCESTFTLVSIHS